MAVIPGSVRVAGFIAFTDSNDTYATQDSIYGRGGYRAVADITARDAITDDRRHEGMMVHVLSDNSYYTLEGGVTNADWTVSALSAPTFSNADSTPADVGGIDAGTSFVIPQTMQQMFDKLLYPYVNPSFTSFYESPQVDPLEVGDEVPANPTFDWTVSDGSEVAAASIDIDDVTGAVNYVTGTNDTGSYTTAGVAAKSLSAPGSNVYRITGTDKDPDGPFDFTEDRTVNWYWRLHYGISANASLTLAQIQALASSILTDDVARTYPMGATGYKYIVHSDDLTDPVSYKDADTMLNVPFTTLADVSGNNAHGVAVTYRVHRSTNELGAAIDIIVA